MVLKTSDVKLPEGLEDIDDLNMYFEAQRKYNRKREAEEFAEGLSNLFTRRFAIAFVVSVLFVLTFKYYFGV